MADTGFKTAGTVESQTNFTNFTTTSLGSSDNSYATCGSSLDVDGQISDFSFGIPASATIDGIEVTIEGKHSTGRDQILVSLSWNDGTSFTATKSNDFDVTEGVKTYGGTVDIWGRTWADSEFTVGTFQAKIEVPSSAAEPSLDKLQIKVYYTVVSPSVSKSPSVSPSASPSVSLSVSPSVSPSILPSPSEGYTAYTRGDENSLPANDTDLETNYSEQDVIDVATNNDVRVAQTGAGQFMTHQYKDFIGSNAVALTWEGQTTLGPSSSTAFFQIYNRNTTTWETTVDSDNTSSANMDFILTGNIADLTNYKNASSVISCRVYQEAI